MAEQNKLESQNQLDNVKLLICEGYAASFNLCISHIVETQAPFTRFLPFKYYVLPYIAKFFPYFEGTWFPLWHYNPAAQQPIEKIHNIPKNLPVIIVHCKQDRLTPYAGALAAYHQLISTGHEQTYLISTERKTLNKSDWDDGHIDVLDFSNDKKGTTKQLIDSIISNKNTVQIEHQQYQPDNKHECQLIANQLLSREKFIKKFDLFLRLSPLILLLFATIRMNRSTLIFNCIGNIYL